MGDPGSFLCPIVESNDGEGVLIHEDIAYCEAVQARLERLYHIDGRDNPEHEHHFTYTGLAAKYRFSTPTNNAPST